MNPHREFTRNDHERRQQEVTQPQDVGFPGEIFACGRAIQSEVKTQNQITKSMLLDEKAARTVLALESFFQHVNEPKDLSDSLANRIEITEGAAELLSTFKGQELDLSGLKDLSQLAAAALAAYKGHLHLDGLEDLSPDVIEEFSGRSWNSTQYLGLNGLTTIHESQARALSSFHGKLGLRGIASISEKCAKIMGSGKASHLYLDGLQSVTANTLKHLLGSRYLVTLDGLETLPDIAENWEDLQDNVNELHVNGLKSTSSQSLKKIASIPIDEIFLNGLEALPQDDERLFDNCGAALFLNGIKKLTEVDLKILGANRPRCSLVLDGLEELDERQAKELVGTDRGTLSLGLRIMSDEVASVLLRSQSNCFIMNRLEELTPFAAEICGRFIWAENVYFNGLQQISDEAFEFLLADYTGQREEWCPGSIDLEGLKQLTPRMRKALENTKHDVTLGETSK